MVLEYQSQPGQYVYTLVQPVDGGWAYIYPADDWATRLARERAVFEGYRLDVAGYVQVGQLHPATTAKASGSL